MAVITIIITVMNFTPMTVGRPVWLARTTYYYYYISLSLSTPAYSPLNFA